MNRQMHAVFLGISGFPFGMAAIQRQTLLAKALVFQNWKTTIISPRSVHFSCKKVKQVGKFQNISYLYLFNPIRERNFILRNTQKFLEPFFEFYVVLKLKKKFGLDVGIISHPNSLVSSLKYRVFSKVIGFKILYNLVENYSERPNTRLLRKVNNFLFNNFGVLFYDGILPISENLNEEFAKNKSKSLIVPIIVDYSYINSTQCNTTDQKYFAYCGSTGYYSSIMFILESFQFLKNPEIKLKLVINGSSIEINKILKQIKLLRLSDKVIIKSNITNHELFCLYKNSIGLLLPLFNTVQDKSRFPHKLAEYLASGVIVNTNPIGDLTNYLSHKKNVLFSEPNDPISYSKNMEWIIQNPDIANKIGMEGKNIAQKCFDYKSLSPILSNFLRNFLN